MKVFISQPIDGRTNEEIKAERELVATEVKNRLGEEIEILDSFFENPPEEANPLSILAKSLVYLSAADLAVFVGEWEKSRGCAIEHDCARRYGIPTMYLPFISK